MPVPSQITCLTRGICITIVSFLERLIEAILQFRLICSKVVSAPRTGIEFERAIAILLTPVSSPCSEAEHVELLCCEVFVLPCRKTSVVHFGCELFSASWLQSACHAELQRKSHYRHLKPYAFCPVHSA